ncbi:MAG: serine/threonine protein kinase [Candidatus Xenobia bacterium]
MSLPTLNQEALQQVVPNLDRAVEASIGGQKLVFDAVIGGQRCALTIIFRKFNPEDGFDASLARARREVKLLQRCESPYVVKPGPIPLTPARLGERDIVYFTEEWIDGTDVHSILEAHGWMEVREVARMGQHVADAIDALWGIASVHRDIKPENIRRRNTGEYLLLDLGAAFDLDDVGISKPGFVPGTYMYYSPEQLDYTGKWHLDFHSDLYALGTVMYECLLGDHPFYVEGMNARDTFRRIQVDEAKPIRERRPEVPEGLETIVLELLRKNPAERVATCQDLVTALAPYA